MNTQAIRKTLSYTQLNNSPIDKVFPLLCPVREEDWLDGWNHQMIYSQSGLIEKSCVFTTKFHDTYKTTWLVTEYDSQNYRIEFVRMTPTDSVVRINISLEKISDRQTKTHISYQYTALSEAANSHLALGLEASFIDAMQWWEKAIDHYISTDNKLLKK